MALNPLGLAFRTVADGLSANAGYRRARELGLKVRRQTFLRLVGSVRAHYGRTIAEIDRPLHLRPRESDVTPIPSQSQRGYVNFVDIFARNKETGEIRKRFMAIRTPTQVSMQRAVDMAVSRYRAAIDRSQTAPGMFGTDPTEVVEGGIWTAGWRYTEEG